MKNMNIALWAAFASFNDMQSWIAPRLSGPPIAPSRNTGTRKAMRAAKKRRRIAARQPKH